MPRTKLADLKGLVCPVGVRQDRRVTVVPDGMSELLADWDVPKGAQLTSVERGTNNRTFVVIHGRQRWVLRVSQNLSADQVRAEQRLLRRLGHVGLPFQVPAPLPALNGDKVVETSAGPATLCPWIPGVRPDLASELALERLGRAIGMLGEAMRDVPFQDAPQDWRGDRLRVHPEVPDVEDLCLELAVAGVRPEQVELLRVASRRLAAWQPKTGSLPVQVVHGDLGASNVLVHKQTGELTGLLDFEIAGADFRVNDLVAALLLSGALEGCQWGRQCAALVRGSVVVRRLSIGEIRAVPELMVCRSVGSVLWRAGRWRRGQARVGDVADRIDELDTALRWLAARGEQLLALLEACGR
jgi:homoserine kinase type II